MRPFLGLFNYFSSGHFFFLPVLVYSPAENKLLFLSFLTSPRKSFPPSLLVFSGIFELLFLD